MAEKPDVRVSNQGNVVEVCASDWSARFHAIWLRDNALDEDPQYSVSFKLKPGELFIVDNTRVLHARKPFSGTGKRWLQGCYADRDGLLSTLAAIEENTGMEAAE